MDKVKTTPENVKEANEALFYATMNLPNAAAHCGMTEREMKHIFREYLKYHAPNYQIAENTFEVSGGKVQSALKTPPVRSRPEGV